MKCVMHSYRKEKATELMNRAIFRMTCGVCGAIEFVWDDGRAVPELVVKKLMENWR